MISGIELHVEPQTRDGSLVNLWIGEKSSFTPAISKERPIGDLIERFESIASIPPRHLQHAADIVGAVETPPKRRK